jgi:hypothetical protein
MSSIELYRFVEGPLVFTQTSVGAPVSYNGETYDPQPLARSQVESKNEMSRASIDIRTSLNNPLALRYLSQPVDRVVTLAIFKQVDGVTNIFWRGRLGAVKATDREVALTFESVFTSLRRPGLRARYQRGCRYALYGHGCALDPENFRMSVLMTGFSGTTLFVSDTSAEPNNRFQGGMVRSPEGTLRYVMSSVVNQVTLARSFDSLITTFLNRGYGQSYGNSYGGYVELGLYPGCAHDMTACQSFNNLDNYGGFPWIPLKNPFGGSSIA